MFVISSLLNKTVPWDALRLPDIKLNNVVLPDPFGPIIPVIEPFLIFKEQFDIAFNPPKDLERFLTCRILEFD